MLQFEFQQWQEYNFAPCGYWQTLLARLLERANRSDHQTSTAAVILHRVRQRSRHVLLDTYTFSSFGVSFFYLPILLPDTNVEGCSYHVIIQRTAPAEDAASNVSSAYPPTIIISFYSI